jgi:hypothetical protein
VLFVTPPLRFDHKNKLLSVEATLRGGSVNKFFGILAGFVLACLPAAAQTQQPIRINCGGTSYTDTNGQVWQADSSYNTGTASTNTMTTTGTSDPTLYRSNRWSGTPLLYSFPVINGNYQVNLLFAENVPSLQAAGARVFNVKLNGPVVLQKFDISPTPEPTPRWWKVSTRPSPMAQSQSNSTAWCKTPRSMRSKSCRSLASLCLT